MALKPEYLFLRKSLKLCFRITCFPSNLMLSKGGRRNCCKAGFLMGLGVLLPNLAGGLMLRKQSDLCREPDAAHELSLPGEDKLPNILLQRARLSL